MIFEGLSQKAGANLNLYSIQMAATLLAIFMEKNPPRELKAKP